MAVKSRADLITDVNTLLADNTSGNISLSDFRTVLINLADSCLNPTTDTGTSGLYEWNGTTQYYANQVVTYNGVWYKANTVPPLDGVFHATDWDLIDNQLLKATVSLSAAQILTLYSSPVEIVPAVSGKAIQVVSCHAKYTYVSAAYATSSTVHVITDGADSHQFMFVSILASGANKWANGIFGSGAATNTKLITNTPLMIQAEGADPTAGDSTLEITVYYLLVD